MTRTRTVQVAAGLGAALAGLLGLAVLAAPPAEGATARTADLFYVQNADSAKLVPLGGRRYDLQLRGVGERAVWFADRPRRDSGQIATRALLGRWDRGETFRRTPPNAALEGTLRGSRRPVTVVLELLRARRTANGVRYRARLVRRPSGDLSHYRGRTGGAPAGPLRLRHVSLLIDSDPHKVVNGCVIVPKTQCAGAQLDGADLAGADLTDAILARVNLVGANLLRANLTGADLTGANLMEAFLFSTDLSGASLLRADLAGVRFQGANLTGADLTGANLTGARICKTTWTDGTIRNDNCT